jgi:N-hydroxyarylamine O-acetyltransferase
MFDLDAYLERIGLSGRPDIAEVHRAHVTSIPFENLDPHRGVAVSLDPLDLQRKLVTERRGGYCFEQNLLLKAALEALGAEVELMLARVRLGAPAGAIRPRSHLVLRVSADGASWHADVGFGLGTLLDPIPFGPGMTQEQSGWRFRVIQDDEELVLQTGGDESWSDVYGFVPQPAPFVDLEVNNWYTSTHPRSPFVTGVIVCANHADGSRTVLTDRAGPELLEQTPEQTTSVPVRWQEVPELLATRFGLAGFALDAEDQIVLAAA